MELTEGRVDILINAAGSRGDPALKIWDLKGSELEDEVSRLFVVFTMKLTELLVLVAQQPHRTARFH